MKILFTVVIISLLVLPRSRSATDRPRDTGWARPYRPRQTRARTLTAPARFTFTVGVQEPAPACCHRACLNQNNTRVAAVIAALKRLELARRRFALRTSQSIRSRSTTRAGHRASPAIKYPTVSR